MLTITVVQKSGKVLPLALPILVIPMELYLQKYPCLLTRHTNHNPPSKGTEYTAAKKNKKNVWIPFFLCDT